MRFFSLFLASLSLVWAAPSSVSSDINSKRATAPKPIAIAYYPGWTNASLNLNPATITKFDMIVFAFALTTPDQPFWTFTDADQDGLLKTFVNVVRTNSVLASLSIGGWTGSMHFSHAVGDATNRTALVRQVMNIVTTYNLDGIDFDWEYPGASGIGCNAHSTNDTANFSAFLQELRAASSNLIITAAAPDVPWLGSDGKPSTDLSGFATSLNYLMLMNYDVNGQFSDAVGPNSPLDDACSSVHNGSATAGVNAWTAANFPRNKILLGVPAYGHSFTVPTSAALDSSQNILSNPQFQRNTTIVGNDACGNPGPGPDQIAFKDLVATGLLNSTGDPANGIIYRYDNCSQTPYIYDPTTQLMVAYDNVQSFAAKGTFIASNGLAGFAVYDATMDYNNLLFNSIRSTF